MLNKANSPATKWAVLVMFFLSALILNYGITIFASRPVDMMAQYGMTQAQLSSIVGLGMLPGALFSIILGNIFDKHGNNFMRYGGFVLLFLAAACQLWRVFATSYLQLFLITFLAGAFYLPTQILQAKLIEAWFPPEKMGLAMGIYGAAAGLGNTLAFLIGPLLQTNVASLTSVFIGYLLVAVLWFFFGRLPHTSARQTQQADKQNAPKVSVKSVLKSKNMWFVMICGGLAAGAPTLLNSVMVNTFLAKGMEATSASMMGVICSICMVVGAFGTGLIVAKRGKYNGVYGSFCLISGIAIFLCFILPASSLSFVLIALGGLFGACGLSINMARIGLLPLTGDFGPECNGIAGGMHNTSMGICMFILPTIVTTIFGGNFYGVGACLFAFFVIIAVVGGIVCPELGTKGKLAMNQSAASK